MFGVIVIAGSTAFYKRYSSYSEKKGYINIERKRVVDKYIRVIKLADKEENF